MMKHYGRWHSPVPVVHEVCVFPMYLLSQPCFMFFFSFSLLIVFSLFVLVGVSGKFGDGEEDGGDGDGLSRPNSQH